MPYSSPDQALEIARQHHVAGRLPEAEAIYRQLLAENPRHADALHLLGVIAHQVGQHDLAIEMISQAIRLNPSAADYHSNLGEAYKGAGKIDRAIESYRAAIKMNRAFIDPYNNLAVTLQNINRMDEALATLRAGLAIQPDHPGALSNLGITLTHLGRTDEAIAAFLKAVTLDPSYAEGYSNLGVLYLGQWRFAEAIAALRRAIELRPGHAESHNNLALAYQAEGRIEEAIASFRRAIELKPGYVLAHSNLLLALHYDPRLTGTLENPAGDPRALFNEHVIWNQRYAAALSQPRTYDNDRDADRRLRIGYVSGDFRQHSVAFFIEPILAGHDRKSVEIFCYSGVRTPDAFTERLKRHADHWIGAFATSDEELAIRIAADRIDILIDLTGHTASNRLGLFARKPAPIQITYLGYPDTTGLTTMDYRITDQWADPPALSEVAAATESREPGSGDEFYTERLIRLPRTAWCYRAPKSSPPVNPLPARKTGQITFGSFNTLAKMSDSSVRLWSEILHKTPGSRLMLKASGLQDPDASSRVHQMFAARDIGADRLVLFGRTPSLDEHLRGYHAVDIALDSFSYHGTTTTCDALWMGVPVVTLAGKMHVSRVGISLLSSLGLGDELVAQTPEHYVRIAVELAGDLPRLAKLRAGLRERMKQSPLTDGHGMARELEKTYRELWCNWCRSA
jgi:protein O-GlcNAc transferase